MNVSITVNGTVIKEEIEPDLLLIDHGSVPLYDPGFFHRGHALFHRPSGNTGRASDLRETHPGIVPDEVQYLTIRLVHSFLHSLLITVHASQRRLCTAIVAVIGRDHKGAPYDMELQYYDLLLFSVG